MYVNTEGIIDIGNQIAEKNKELTIAYSPVDAAIDSVANSWDGQAGEAFSGLISKLRENCIDYQSEVINAYSGFLINGIATAYEKVEEANISLSDAFK